MPFLCSLFSCYCVRIFFSISLHILNLGAALPHGVHHNVKDFFNAFQLFGAAVAEVVGGHFEHLADLHERVNADAAAAVLHVPYERICPVNGGRKVAGGHSKLLSSEHDSAPDSEPFAFLFGVHGVVLSAMIA